MRQQGPGRGREDDWWWRELYGDAPETGGEHTGGPPSAISDTLDERIESALRTVGRRRAAGPSGAAGTPQAGPDRRHPPAAPRVPDPRVGWEAPEPPAGPRATDARGGTGRSEGPAGPGRPDPPVAPAPAAGEPTAGGRAAPGAAPSGGFVPSGFEPRPWEPSGWEPRPWELPGSAAPSPAGPAQPPPPPLAWRATWPAAPPVEAPDVEAPPVEEGDRAAPDAEAPATEPRDAADRATEVRAVQDRAAAPAAPPTVAPSSPPPVAPSSPPPGAPARPANWPSPVADSGAAPGACPQTAPDALDDRVPDTVLDGVRFGSVAVRAVSQRGDAACRRGDVRGEEFRTARFGTGRDALLLVAVATGPGTTGVAAHRAARDGCAWAAGTVGGCSTQLAQDLRAGRRDALKAGLQRLTDRGYGRLRARAADLATASDGHPAALRCLLLPADPDCRTRVFFGVGAGGLFRLRDGGWEDLEPTAAAPADAQPTPPAPEAPGGAAPRPAPFRFRVVTGRPGDVLLLCGTGLAGPLSGDPDFAARLAAAWSVPGPPALADFFTAVQPRGAGDAEDRTAAAVWEP
ncbi:hypothetical protein ABTY53_12460 [Streptomyces noursei]|uniref:hypothetical protein n=1 Tax=Streptomyces noursei TaxID=1971 RepID=UPI00331DD603